MPFKHLLCGAVLASSIFFTGCIADADSASSDTQAKTDETAEKNTLAVASLERQIGGARRCPDWASRTYWQNLSHWDRIWKDAVVRRNASKYNSTEYRYWNGVFINASASYKYWGDWGNTFARNNRCTMQY